MGPGGLGNRARALWPLPRYSRRLAPVKDDGVMKSSRENWIVGSGRRGHDDKKRHKGTRKGGRVSYVVR